MFEMAPEERARSRPMAEGEKSSSGWSRRCFRTMSRNCPEPNRDAPAPVLGAVGGFPVRAGRGLPPLRGLALVLLRRAGLLGLRHRRRDRDGVGGGGAVRELGLACPGELASSTTGTSAGAGSAGSADSLSEAPTSSVPTT